LNIGGPFAPYFFFAPLREKKAELSASFVSRKGAKKK